MLLESEEFLELSPEFLELSPEPAEELPELDFDDAPSLAIAEGSGDQNEVAARSAIGRRARAEAGASTRQIYRPGRR